jgi:putative ABC transport system permease protein
MKRFWYLRRRPEAIQSDIDEELRLHLEMRAEELIARGMTPTEARREAVRQFGDLAGTREYCRQQDQQKDMRMRRRLLVEDLVQDLRIGLRGLLRAPLTTAIIILTVGLGIGATTAIFAAIDAAYLSPLPYADPDRLVRIYTEAPPNKFPFSVADYLAFTAQQTSFDRTAGYSTRPMAFTDDQLAERLTGKIVTWGYFGVLGIRPAIGRDFTEADGKPGAPPTAIVSSPFWKDRLHGRSDVLDSRVRLDGVDYTVVGVLPDKLGPLEEGTEFFTAAQYGPPPRKGPFFIWMIGRLRPNVDRAAAAEELHAINKRIFPIWRASYQDQRASWGMMDLKTYVIGDVATIAGLAIIAVGLVWVIACVNASSLLLARATSRGRELAVRAALGATRGRVVRYLLAESLLLATGAATLGIPLAVAGVRIVRAFGATFFPRTAEIAFDGPVLWLLIALTVASALLFGLVPAIHGSGREGTRVNEALRASGRSSTASIGVRRLRRVLVAGQFAIATPLLVVAGLLLATLSALGRVDVGFDTHNVVSGGILLPTAQYRDAGSVASFWDQLRRRVEALPGVRGVTFSDGRFPDGIGNFNNFDLEDAPSPPGQSQPVVPWLSVTPEYFTLLGLSLVEGRLLNEDDTIAPNVVSVVVDRAWATRFFPQGRAIGRRMIQGGCSTCPRTTVVGVVSNVKYLGLDKSDEGTVYQALPPTARGRFLIVRTNGTPSTIIASIRQVVRQLDPNQPFSRVATLDELVDRYLDRRRSLSVLISAVASVALLLSVVGVYGVMAYYVQQHTKDIGIRLALGGSRGDLFRLVVGQGMTVVAGGVLIGVLAAFAVTRAMASLLFGVGAADPRTFVAVVALLSVVALVACAFPAGRAIRVEPASVLRED